MPWRESDITEPVNIYGASKLAGEKAIQMHSSKYLIFSHKLGLCCKRKQLC